MMRLKAHRQTNIEARSYRKPQEAQMTSTMVECLQGIQMGTEAAAQIRMDQEIRQTMMNTSPELTTHIQDVLCAQMPYGGAIISHNTSTNDGLGSDMCTRRPRGSPRVIRLVRKGFGAFALIISQCGICMQNISCLHALYQRQPVLGIPNTAMDLVGI
jgi:hypothetical protein